MPVPLDAGPSVYPKDGGARIASISNLRGLAVPTFSGRSAFARAAHKAGGRGSPTKGGSWRSTVPALYEARGHSDSLRRGDPY